MWIYPTTNFQKTIALSSTEAELVALTDAGKMILYVRSVLEELGLEQTLATPVYEDNKGCMFIAKAGQPSKRTRHVAIRELCAIDWVEQDLLNIKRINTADNSADPLTKALGRIQFYRHNDLLMGRIRPKYTSI